MCCGVKYLDGTYVSDVVSIFTSKEPGCPAYVGTPVGSTKEMASGR